MTGRRWLVAVAVVWAVVLVVAAYTSSRGGEATVREQSSLAQGRQTLDEAVVTVLAAAGSGVTTEVGEYRLTTGCRLTLAWRGSTLARQVLLGVPAGQEPALLDRLAERLPPEWEARHHSRTDTLSADAGDFVTVKADVAEPGQVRLTLSTGCRPGTDPELDVQ